MRPLPPLGRGVPAGFPSPADDHLEDGIDLARLLVERPAAATFLMIARGGRRPSGLDRKRGSERHG